MTAGGARLVITAILSVALLLTAAVLITATASRRAMPNASPLWTSNPSPVLTIAMGVVLGILVTFSSVGCGRDRRHGAVLLYPRLPMARIVGSDIAHAVPLTLVAGLGHGAMGSLDLHVYFRCWSDRFPESSSVAGPPHASPTSRCAMSWPAC